MTDHGKPSDPFERAFMARPPAKPGAYHVGPYAFSEDELDDLLEAVWQVLDDFGEEGRNCCGAAKYDLRIALQPFLAGNPDLDCVYTLEAALKARAETDR